MRNMGCFYVLHFFMAGQHPRIAAMEDRSRSDAGSPAIQPRPRAVAGHARPEIAAVDLGGRHAGSRSFSAAGRVAGKPLVLGGRHAGKPLVLGRQAGWRESRSFSVAGRGGHAGKPLVIGGRQGQFWSARLPERAAFPASIRSDFFAPMKLQQGSVANLTQQREEIAAICRR
jgi:hypothetical protein